MSRAGFAAIIGAPNAGKSTLVNRLVGAKVSIVTRKVQTTRFPVRAILMVGDAQIVIVDTPGVFEPRRRLDRAMARAAWAGAEGADVVVHLVDAAAEDRAAGDRARPADRLAARDTAAIAAKLKGADRRAILALNKVDLVRKANLLRLTDRLFDEAAYGRAVMISASTGDGLDELQDQLAEAMPEGPWLYPDDQVADISLRMLAAEITREKIYLRVHEELPYQAMVETTLFDERVDGSVRIEQTIFVERDGQRVILLGKGGATLRSIGQASREELAATWRRPVHLFLHVKVSPGWAEDRARYTDVGLDFDV